MATDYKALGKRISNARKQAGITQEALGEQLNMTRKHISVIESAIKRPSLDALVDIANALDVSTDDLLVDSLMHSTSTSNSEIHRLLLDCNEIEQEILTRMVREMKAILYGCLLYTSCFCVFQSKLLCSFPRQTIFCAVPWIKADDVMVAFDFILVFVFLVLAVQLSAGRIEGIGFTVQTVQIKLIPHDAIAVFVQNRLFPKFVMFENQVLQRSTIVGTLTCDML